MKSFITIKQLAYIIGLSAGTVLYYCGSWMLSKYLYPRGNYEYTEDSINRFYTYLYMKRKHKAMTRLKQHFSFAELVEVE